MKKYKHEIIQGWVLLIGFIVLGWFVMYSPMAKECRAKGGTNFPPCEKITKERIR